MSKGFRIFTTDPFAKSYETKEGNIAIIEMLFSTSLVALILSPRRLQITNTKVRRVSEWIYLLDSCAGLMKGRSGLSTVNAFVYFIAPIYNMRIDFSNDRAGSQTEPEATGDRVRRSDLSLRYPDHEAPEYYCNLSESERYGPAVFPQPVMRLFSNT